MSDYVTLTLEEAFKDVLAHLAAAHSLLEHSPKTGAPSNKMFDMMLADYAASIERGRKAFAAYLSRAAEPVANRVHVVCRWQGNVCEFIEVEDDSGHSVSIPWTYGKDGYSELILYTHPPEPARDANVEKVARAIYAHVFNVSIPRMGVRTATFEEVWNVPAERERMLTQARAAIAAMAQESGDAT